MFKKEEKGKLKQRKAEEVSEREEGQGVCGEIRGGWWSGEPQEWSSVFTPVDSMKVWHIHTCDNILTENKDL